MLLSLMKSDMEALEVLKSFNSNSNVLFTGKILLDLRLKGIFRLIGGWNSQVLSDLKL